MKNDRYAGTISHRNIGYVWKILMTSTVIGMTAPVFAQDTVDPRIKAPVVQSAVAKDVAHGQRSFTGIVVARVQSSLGFRVGGKVIQRLVDVGESVTKGQPLMKLDDTDFNLSLRAKENAVVSARAAVSRTQADEQRFSRLLSAGATSHQVYDEAKQSFDTAVAQLDAALADADFAKNETGYAVLYADEDGIITDTAAEPGQVVSAGSPVVKLAHGGDREASVSLPETLRPQVGSKGTAKIYGSDGAEVIVRLRQLSKAADPATRTFEARYVLESEGDVPLGSTVKVSIDSLIGSASAENVQVPIGSIWDNGRETGVWEINDGKTVKFHPVKVLSVSEESAVVSGLTRGATVVAVGVNLLNDGMEVRSSNNEVASK